MTSRTGSPPSRATPPSWTLIDSVADANEAPRAYAEWLTQTPSASDDYLFSARVVRFGLRAQDRLLAAPDLRLAAHERGVELASQALGGALHVAGLTLPFVQRACAYFDGTHTLDDVRRALPDAQAELDRFLSNAFGRVLFAPQSVAELEVRISGSELTRFVGTPYEVERAYWENMADVREHLGAALQEVRDSGSFVRALRRMHVLALLGASLNNYYRPASRIGARGVQPGALYRTPTTIQQSPSGTLLLEGPRVGVPFVGGKLYHALVCEHDPAALQDERHVQDDSGLSWGRVLRARAPSETQDRDWFLPPRPMQDEHLESLYAAHAEATRARPEELGRALARFHFRFVRLHPFRCANQSLSMNLVNALLLDGFGKSMPHGLLDQFALRLSERAYEDVFLRALARARPRENPGQRWAALRAERDDAFRLIQQLQAARDLAEARALCEASPSAARAALIQ